MGTKRYTVYDIMDGRGDFLKNPANPGARDPVTGESTYTGPVPFPKMFYHPKGERVKMPPQSKVKFGEIVTKIANNQEEADELKKAGWWDHPADAMRAAGEEAPPKSSEARLAKLQEENEALLKELAAIKAEKEAVASSLKPAGVPLKGK